MEHTIHHITNKLEARLPDDSDHFRPSELLDADIPSFVVERVKIELFRNLSESIVPPETDWANMNSESVETSWRSFIEAIRAEAHLPRGFVHPVLETAVADILEMLTKPRAILPDLLFGVDDALDFETMLERKKSVVVFTYLVDILPRYMEKKELEEITKQQCKNIIQRVDERVTASYTPLNWVQLLEPLFELCSGHVDSELLRLFFEDKQNKELAQCFDEEPGDVTRRQAIEILSGYHLKDSRKGEDNDERKQENKKTAENESDLFTGKSQSEINTQPLTPPNKEQEHSDEEGHESAGARSHTRFDEDDDNAGAGAENQPLHTMFGSDDAEEQKPVSNRSRDDNEDENEKEGETEVTDTDTDEREDVIDNPVDEPDEDLPMWQKFAMQQRRSHSEKHEDRDASKNTGIGTDTGTGNKNKKNTPGNKQEMYHQLVGHLTAQEKYFTKHIFKDDNTAYHDALRELAGFDTWEKASRHLQHEIFKHNLVDIFAEPAVDFTDQLQNFYTEYKTQR